MPVSDDLISYVTNCAVGAFSGLCLGFAIIKYIEKHDEKIKEEIKKEIKNMQHNEPSINHWQNILENVELPIHALRDRTENIETEINILKEENINLKKENKKLQKKLNILYNDFYQNLSIDDETIINI